MVEEEIFNVIIVFEDDQNYYSLSSVLAGVTHLEEHMVKKIMIKILIALNHLHSGGFIHRDLNCKNIMVSSK